MPVLFPLLSLTMADAIGILGFALHAAHKIYNVATTIKDAPDDVAALQNEAEHVRDSLSELIDILQTETDGPAGPARTEARFRALIAEARTLTESVNTLLDKATIRKADGSYEVTRVRWPLYIRRAKKLADDFKNFKQLLSAILSIHTVYAAPGVSFQLTELWFSLTVRQMQRQQGADFTASQQAQIQAACATLYDVGAGGLTVIHVSLCDFLVIYVFISVRKCMISRYMQDLDGQTVLNIISYLLDAGASSEWLYGGL